MGRQGFPGRDAFSKNTIFDKRDTSYMESKKVQKRKILIADDSEINRSILADILSVEYEIIEAENGAEAVATLEKCHADISAVLLDIVMPHMNGFEVLTVMNQRHWIDELPVIIISAESGANQIERAFDLGATDFIMRPFDALLVYRRVVNTVLLYAKQKKLVELVIDQIDEKERRSQILLNILSHVVEFRNGESGQHILHVRTFTEVMLRQLQRITDRYPLSQADISIISTTSAFHDIGKMAIDEKVLNKPGRLTQEEFEHMKQHTVFGAQMLEKVPVHKEVQLVQTAWEICRWHHERYDGKGYPDGLVGDEIPISAQVVALADVYDALTSDRCYKKAIPHKEAVQMILDGKCGVFNPILLECLNQVEATLDTEFSYVQEQEESISRANLVREMLQGERIFASERSLRLLDEERMRSSSFSAITNETRFEYSKASDTLRLSAWSAEKLGLDALIVHPAQCEKLIQVVGEENLRAMCQAISSASQDHPLISQECLLQVAGEYRWYQFTLQLLWSEDDTPRCTGLIGKAVDIHDSMTRLRDLEKRASHDAATGLLNRASAKEQILHRIQMVPNENYALLVFDLDHLKHINDTYGHLVGSRVLKYVADQARKSVRGNDIVARIGGDEFLIFMCYNGTIEPVVDRIFHALIGQCDEIPVSVSMGVSKTCVVGHEYDTLFHAADQALYSAKRAGRGRCMYYDESMKELLTPTQLSL